MFCIVDHDKRQPHQLDCALRCLQSIPEVEFVGTLDWELSLAL